MISQLASMMNMLRREDGIAAVPIVIAVVLFVILIALFMSCGDGQDG